MNKISENVRKQNVNISDPMRNRMNYTYSPYNPIALEDFKKHANQIYREDLLQLNFNKPNPTIKKL